jgi:topoisomerase-4 subunit A
VSAIPIKGFDEPGRSLVFVTKRGQVKRTELKEYFTNRSIGIVACKVGENDAILEVQLSTNDQDIMLVTKLGMAIRFSETEVNPMGRAAAGVRGIQLKDDDEVVSAEWIKGEEGELLVVSDLAYAKRSLILDYPVQGRGGKGIVTFEFRDGKRVKPNGSQLVKAFSVKEELLITAFLQSGERVSFSSEKTPIEQRKSTGRQVVALNKTDLVSDLLKSD